MLTTPPFMMNEPAVVEIPSLNVPPAFMVIAELGEIWLA
jgi:hypothetical protein